MPTPIGVVRAVHDLNEAPTWPATPNLCVRTTPGLRLSTTTDSERHTRSLSMGRPRRSVPPPGRNGSAPRRADADEDAPRSASPSCGALQICSATDGGAGSFCHLLVKIQAGSAVAFLSGVPGPLLRLYSLAKLAQVGWPVIVRWIRPNEVTQRGATPNRRGTDSCHGTTTTHHGENCPLVLNLVDQLREVAGGIG